VEHGLLVARRERAAERDLLNRLDELALPPLGRDAHAAVVDHDLQAAGGEAAGEYQLARVLADVDEAAGAGQSRTEAADVDVAEAVYFGHAQAGQVEPAAVVEVELLVLVQQRLRVDRGAEVQPALRHAADHAGLGGERQVIEPGGLGPGPTHCPRATDAQCTRA